MVALGSFTGTITLEQAGSSIGGIWTEATVADPTPITVQVGGLIGLVYNVRLAGGIPFNMTSAFTPARALDPPIWVSAGTLTLVNQSATGGFVDVFLVPDPSPDLFSNGNPPTLTGATLLSEDTLLGTIAAPPDTIAIVLDADANTSIRAQVTSKTDWTGRVAFVLDWTVGLASTLTVSLTDTILQRFFSGLAGGPYGGPIRVLRDGRYAMPALSGQLVEDGDQPNLWVRSFDADPDDPEQEYRPRPGEGTVNDKVPNP